MNSSQLAISRSEVELFTPDADHDLVVLAQLAHQRREVRVAAHDHERVDVRLGVAEVERVDDHADVGGVLARHAHVRDLDQLERRLVHRRLEFLVALPVAVGLLDHDAALEQQRSSTLSMSNFAYFASRTPSATFSKSQNTAMLLIVGFAMAQSYTRVATSAAASKHQRARHPVASPAGRARRRRIRARGRRASA